MIAGLFALALVVAACGDDDANTDAADLPVNGDDPAAGTCPEGTADCNDTPGDLPGPDLEPGDDPGAQPGTGALVDGGLTVDEALVKTPADGIIAVKGFLVIDDTDGTRLCSVLAESMPPQCGGGALELVGLDLEMIDVTVADASGVQWTDETISLFGTVDDGVLTVASTVVG